MKALGFSVSVVSYNRSFARDEVYLSCDFTAAGKYPQHKPAPRELKA